MQRRSCFWLALTLLITGCSQQSSEPQSSAAPAQKTATSPSAPAQVQQKRASAKSSSGHADFEEVFRTGSKVSDSENDQAVMTVVNVGEIKLPSGKIIACDPCLMEAGKTRALVTSVKPGSYPVDIALAKIAALNNDTFVAAARIKFREGKPVKYVVAQNDGTAAKSGQAYPVDAGLGCFIDADVLNTAQADPFEAARLEVCEHDYREELKKPALLTPFGKGTIVSFPSGFGDGAYGSWWGLDESGAPLCLITDFGVVDGLKSSPGDHE